MNSLPRYKVITRDFSTGNKTAEISTFVTLSYYKEVNAIGVAKIVWPLAVAGPPAKNSYLEIWRKLFHPNSNFNIDWYSDFNGIVRSIRQYQDEQGRDYVEVTAYSLLHLLEWRIVNWKGTEGVADNRTVFIGQPAETIVKTLVNYNMTSLATVANGRIKNGQVPNFSIEADGGRGSNMNYNCAYYTVSDAVQEICKVGGGDVDIIKPTSSTTQFKWYAGQLGTDRTAVGAGRLVFSPEFGNVAEPEYSLDYSKEKTACTVAGLGTCQLRKITVVTGNSFVTQTNDYEMFADARQSNYSPVDVGNIELYNNRARQRFNFKVLQIPGCRYGLHYFLGDLCIAIYKTYQATVKIQRVNVSFSGKDTEKIEVLIRTL